MHKNKEPRIILYDLETLPDMDEAMKHWTGLSNYPGQTIKAQLQSVICFGFKEFGRHNKTKVINAWDFKRRWQKSVNDDYLVVKQGREVLASADCVVTWNGKRFDEKVMKTRLEFWGLPPLPPIPHVDLKQVAASKLFFFNNKMQNVGEFLIGEGKREHEGWDLWVKVRQKHKASMRKMSWYCEGDVLLLEKIFRRLRKHTKDLPNQNLFTIGQRHVCPGCGSTRLRSHGWRHTQTNSYRQFYCKDCGGFGRTDKKGENPRAID